MQRFFIFSLLSVVSIVTAFSVATTLSPHFATGVEELLGSIFFVESTTTTALQNIYRSSKPVRVLIVAGHDAVSWGTDFRGMREADLTAALASELAFLLSADSHFEPVMVRTREGYAKEFTDYFANEELDVRAFLANKKKVMKDLMRQGMVEKEEGVSHNSAPSAIAYKLYAINKWANEHAIDVVIHIHFNDYPRRSRSTAGRYRGFAVYVPDKQYSNARPSRVLASSLALEFSKAAPPSNHPQEGAIVPDQELIALGSYNTLDPAAVLIEYGYIYENRFKPEALDETLRELAFQTYLGLQRFFRDD